MLEAFPGALHVEVSEGPRFVAMVLADRFEGQNEAQRQAAIWTHLWTKFSDDELRQLEFIFTDTPTERAVS